MENARVYHFSIRDCQNLEYDLFSFCFRYAQVAMANKLILGDPVENRLQKYFIRQNIENIPFQSGSSEQTIGTFKASFIKFLC